MALETKSVPLPRVGNGRGQQKMPFERILHYREIEARGYARGRSSRRNSRRARERGWPFSPRSWRAPGLPSRPEK